MNDTLLISVTLIAIGVAIYAFLRKRNSGDDNALLLLQNQMQGQIAELTRTLDTRLGQSGSMMQKVSEELGRVGESHRQVVSIADQLKKLQDVLRNPKQRGTLGEYHLEAALKNTLPPGTYQLQYPFRDGTKVDAVIFYDEKIIPIDSKFSLENYMRILEAETDTARAQYETALYNDLKTRIEETAKYIKPTEDTLEFAFMFIPSEALYYDLLINKIGQNHTRNLLEYAVQEKRVHIVSPTTMYAYLQTILHGLRQIDINRSAEQLKKNIGELMRHLSQYETFMKKLGATLKTVVNTYSNAYREFLKIDKDVYKITGTKMNIEPVVLEIENPADEAEDDATLPLR